LINYPEISPIAIEIGPLQVRWYGLMYLGGFLIAWLGLRMRSKNPGSPISPSMVDDLLFLIALGVIIGGRLGYIIFYSFNSVFSDPLVIFRVWEGGMSFHGGLIGVAVAMIFFAKKINKPIFSISDFVSPWVPPGLGLGRIGNFINGELWGSPTSADAIWAVSVRGVPRHPSQIYEAFLEGIVLFIILWHFSSKPRPLGVITGAFLFFYGLFRVIVEFVRLPDLHLNPQAGGYIAFGWVTMGQLLSLPMIISGVILCLLAYKQKK
tara:strand:- start:368 stop:1162 length:795 start_codon:yes stop_codon:yes gene_type:complete